MSPINILASIFLIVMALYAVFIAACGAVWVLSGISRLVDDFMANPRGRWFLILLGASVVYAGVGAWVTWR